MAAAVAAGSKKLFHHIEGLLRVDWTRSSLGHGECPLFSGQRTVVADRDSRRRNRGKRSFIGDLMVCGAPPDAAIGHRDSRRSVAFDQSPRSARRLSGD